MTYVSCVLDDICFLCFGHETLRPVVKKHNSTAFLLIKGGVNDTPSTGQCESVFCRHWR